MTITERLELLLSSLKPLDKSRKTLYNYSIILGTHVRPTYRSRYSATIPKYPRNSQNAITLRTKKIETQRSSFSC